MIELWDGKLDLRHLVERWVGECVPGDYDIEKCLKDVSEYAANEGVVFVMKDGESVVGALAVGYISMFFTQDTFVAVRYWYVLPNYRSRAHELIRAAKKWTKCQSWKKMLICSNKLSIPCDDFYKKTGFKEFETVYIGDV